MRLPGLHHCIPSGATATAYSTEYSMPELPIEYETQMLS